MSCRRTGGEDDIIHMTNIPRENANNDQCLMNAMTELWLLAIFYQYTHNIALDHSNLQVR